MRRREAGRGAVPAGLATQAERPGGVGAPPGPITRPCQELADDRKVLLPLTGRVDDAPSLNAFDAYAVRSASGLANATLIALCSPSPAL